ncbi:GntR family transcriptional regulator [Dyella ginsengisoli]|uniref:GntR family transcriptional regulator n=1 Tax=Dyella ginsengisoli TaxID=363848 RepID=UPI000349D5A8|nr:GntR family transcriptional regulator [Dyella ginsengisoli]
MPRSLIEQAVNRLREEILRGRLPAGSKLAIDEIRTRYRVSGGTLREALSLLVSDGLIKVRAQRGFYVAPMSLEDMQDLARTRILLECEAVRQSVKHGDVEWEMRLVAAFHRLSLVEERTMRDPVNHFDQWEQDNRAFHEALLSACPSTWTLRFVSILYMQMERYRRLTSTHNPPDRNVSDEHRALLDSALARESDRCADLMRVHIESSISVAAQIGLLR